MIKTFLIYASLLSFVIPAYGADQVHEKRENFRIFVKTLTGEAKNFEYEDKRTFENVMTSIFKHFKVPGRVIYGSTLLNELNDQKELKNFAQKDQTLPFDANFPPHMDLLYFLPLSRNPQENPENYYYGNLSLKDGHLFENGNLLEPVPAQQPQVLSEKEIRNKFTEFHMEPDDAKAIRMFQEMSEIPEVRAHSWYDSAFRSYNGQPRESSLFPVAPAQQPLVSQAPQAPKTFEEFNESYGNINKAIQEKDYEKAAILLTSMSGKGQEDHRYEQTKKLLEDHGVQGFW